MKLLITVDTEADNQWKQPDVFSYSNIQALPRFDTLCRHYAMTPTYLTTYDVLDDTEAAEIISQLHAAGSEIGAHLHSWSTPPLPDGVSPYIFSAELDGSIVLAQLTYLTDKITHVTGRKPTSFRGGRWSYTAEIGKILAEFGYLVDSSVTPGVNWQRIITKGNIQAAPNYAMHSVVPHILEYETGKILEVPMTIMQRSLMHTHPAVAHMVHSLPVSFKTIIQQLAKPRWLRIFPNTTAKDLIFVYTKAKKLGLPVAVFMIHSSELIVGGSPYSKTQEVVDHIYSVFEEFLQFVQADGGIGSTLSGFAQDFTTQKL